jgi:hypothetical protein
LGPDDGEETAGGFEDGLGTGEATEDRGVASAGGDT